jgi:hypothetical protein
MGFRLPQNFSSQLRNATAPSALELEIIGEKAASLGRAGRLVQQKLKVLHGLSAQDANRPAIVQSAADAVQSYFVQRELCGLINHDGPIEDYGIPPEVLARLGAK